MPRTSARGHDPAGGITLQYTSAGCWPLLLHYTHASPLSIGIVLTESPAPVVGSDQVDTVEELLCELLDVIGFGQAARQSRQHDVVRVPRSASVHHRTRHLDLPL